MLSRCLPFLALAASAVASPALAGNTLTCRLKDQSISDLAIKIEQNGANANVLIGTLTHEPQLVFQGAPASKDGNKLVFDAWPEQMVGTTDKLKCAELKKFFHLELTPDGKSPNGFTKYVGELGSYPWYPTNSDRKSGFQRDTRKFRPDKKVQIKARKNPCKSFAAPEVQEEKFYDVICLTK